jgi:hypothetical protein
METDAKRGGSNGKAQPSARTARRIVLLAADDHSELERILVEYAAAEVHTANLDEDLERFANEYRGRTIAAEWEGPRGRVRFLWCCKGPGEVSPS